MRGIRGCRRGCRFLLFGVGGAVLAMAISEGGRAGKGVAICSRLMKMGLRDGTYYVQYASQTQNLLISNAPQHLGGYSPVSDPEMQSRADHAETLILVQFRPHRTAKFPRRSGALAVGR